MVYTGKTVEEALLRAEVATGIDKNNLIYEIVDEKKGLLKSREVTIEIKGERQKGKLEIKNGELIYHRGDTPPSIIPGENIVVKVNGNIIYTETDISEHDYVKLEPLNTEMDRKVEFTISDDQMEAYIYIAYIPKKVYQVVDKEPCGSITAEAVLIDEVRPPKATQQDIEELLKENKITHGIRWEHVSKVIDGGLYLIASGQKPEESVDDSVKYFFNIEEDSRPVETDGKVDYYNIRHVDFVEKGKVLAIREEGRDGKIGTSVYGNVILPKKRNIIKLVKGPGVELLDNGNRAISLIEGMPSLRGASNAICVLPVHNIDGDVDVKTGNIQFEGDIVIKGSVREGFKVKSGNDLIVFGDVAEANLMSGGTIRIAKNIISSTIKAGSRQLGEAKTLEYLKTSTEFVQKLLTAYNDLKKNNKLYPNVNVGLVFKVLVESKHKDLKEKILEGKKFISENDIKDDMKNLWNQFMNLFLIIENSNLTDPALLANFYKYVMGYIEKYEIVSTPADIIMTYAQNSDIYASNNVEIKGKGCYNTNITAENKVLVTGKPGIFRGGQVFAVNGMNMQEVGSTAGVLTVLKTTKAGVIEAKTAYQNTVICIDEFAIKIEDPCKTLRAYFDKGEIVIEKFKL